MKAAGMAIVLATLAATGSAAKKGEPDVVIYLHHGSQSAGIVGLAEGQAQRMLERIGIAVAWRLGAPGPNDRAEVVEAVLLERPVAEDFRPGSLAFATVGERVGTRIEVLYDRVRAAGPPSATPSILAHVLAHEITHILEGTPRHSESGVMKARWEAADFREYAKSLPFAPEDVRLVQAWAERHNRTLLAAR